MTGEKKRKKNRKKVKRVRRARTTTSQVFSPSFSRIPFIPPLLRLPPPIHTDIPTRRKCCVYVPSLLPSLSLSLVIWSAVHPSGGAPAGMIEISNSVGLYSIRV